MGGTVDVLVCGAFFTMTIASYHQENSDNSGLLFKGIWYNDIFLFLREKIAKSLLRFSKAQSLEKM